MNIKYSSNCRDIDFSHSELAFHRGFYGLSLAALFALPALLVSLVHFKLIAEDRLIYIAIPTLVLVIILLFTDKKFVVLSKSQQTINERMSLFGFATDDTLASFGDVKWVLTDMVHHSRKPHRGKTIHFLIPTVFALTKTGELIKIKEMNTDGLKDANHLAKGLAEFCDANYLEGKEETETIINVTPGTGALEVSQKDLSLTEENGLNV